MNGDVSLMLRRKNEPADDRTAKASQGQRRVSDECGRLKAAKACWLSRPETYGCS